MKHATYRGIRCIMLLHLRTMREANFLPRKKDPFVALPEELRRAYVLGYLDARKRYHNGARAFLNGDVPTTITCATEFADGGI